MKCIAKIKVNTTVKRKQIKDCPKKAVFIFYCAEHWNEKSIVIKNLFIRLKKSYSARGIAILISLIGAFKGYLTIVEWSKSDHQRFIETKELNKILAPFKGQKKTIIHFGSGQLEFEMRENGWSMADQNFSLGCTKVEGKRLITDDSFNFSLKLEDGVFLISIIVRDLKTGRIITEIQNNKVLIDNIGVNNYYTNSKKLEIRDQYGYVAFQLWVNNKDQLEMRGYFYGKLCTTFITDEPMQYVQHDDPAYQLKSVDFASKLKPLFTNQYSY